MVVPFGAGLSLTEFKLAFSSDGGAGDADIATAVNANPTNAKLATDGTSGNLTYTITVENVGAVTGDAVVMAYVVPFNVGLKQYPLKSLFDFGRLDDISPAARSTVSFTVNREALLLVSQTGDKVSTPGEYTLSFEDGAGQVLTAAVTITGKEVVVEAFPTVPSPE